MSIRIFRYKYVPFNEGSLAIIKDGTMKFTNPKDFNDPFDCYPELDIKATSEFVKKTITPGEKNKVDNIIKNKKGNLSPAKKLLERQKYLNQPKYTPEEYFEKFNNVGICCLSRNPLNLLMWAHYASEHKGFVVEFSIPVRTGNELTEFRKSINKAILSNEVRLDDIKKLRFDGIQKLLPSKVEYKQDKPIINSPDAFQKHFLTKSLDWKYEQEERVIDDIRKAGIHFYNREQILKSVIAGMKMSDDDFVTLKNTVDAVNKELGINVTIHKTQAIKGKFALFVPDRDDLNIHNDDNITLS